MTKENVVVDNKVFYSAEAVSKMVRDVINKSFGIVRKPRKEKAVEAKTETVAAHTAHVAIVKRRPGRPAKIKVEAAVPAHSNGQVE